MALCRGLGGGQGLPATRGLSPSVSPLPPGWGGGVCVTGALAGLEVEGRILLTAPTPCDRAQSPVSVALLLEGKRLNLPPLLPPAPSITPRSRGHPGRPWDPKNAPPGLAIPQLLPEEGGGAAGRVSRRSPHPPPPQTLSASRFLSSPGCKAHTDVGLSAAIRGLR